MHRGKESLGAQILHFTVIRVQLWREGSALERKGGMHGHKNEAVKPQMRAFVQQCPAFVCNTVRLRGFVPKKRR